MPPSAFRLDMAQILVEGGKPAANLDRAVSAIRRAGELGCRVVVLPECLDIGWTHPSTRDFAQPIPGPHFAWLAQAAKDANVYVSAGLVKRAGPKIFNAAVVIGPSVGVRLDSRSI